ncbi:hypothetical protein D027_4670A, partial [Vibrio parahaemolyticus 861]
MTRRGRIDDDEQTSKRKHGAGNVL